VWGSSSEEGCLKYSLLVRRAVMERGKDVYSYIFSYKFIVYSTVYSFCEVYCTYVLGMETEV
jgi:hypothetical protein